MTRLTLAIILLSLTAAVASAPAQAQNGTLTRSFVSSAGSDSNACTITAPCASFAHAYTVIGANGIIAALDPGKYGPLSITGPVTVNGNGWAAITGPAQGNAIIVNAVSGNVILTGLEIDGAGTASNGIPFNSGDTLTITNCTLQNFGSNGVLMQPTSGTVGIFITNTNASNNRDAGISYYTPLSGSASAIGVFDHVVTNNEIDGISIYNGNSTAPSTFSISNCIASKNTLDGNSAGINIGSEVSPITVSIDHCNLFNNTSGILATTSDGGFITLSIDSSNINDNTIGVNVEGFVKALLGRSVVTSNTQNSIYNTTSPNAFYTYQNNQINLNGTSNEVGGSALTRAAISINIAPAEAKWPNSARRACRWGTPANENRNRAGSSAVMIPIWQSDLRRLGHIEFCLFARRCFTRCSRQRSRDNCVQFGDANERSNIARRGRRKYRTVSIF